MDMRRNGPLSVLFVEDEPDIRVVVEIALGMDPDITLTAFDTPTAALDAVDRSLTPFDVALLNIKLPAMTGVELMQELRARPAYTDLPVVFITSGVTTHAGHRGTTGTIAKPFDPVRLADTLRRTMAAG